MLSQTENEKVEDEAALEEYSSDGTNSEGEKEDAGEDGSGNEIDDDNQDEITDEGSTSSGAEPSKPFLHQSLYPKANSNKNKDKNHQVSKLLGTKESDSKGKRNITAVLGNDNSSN